MYSGCVKCKRTGKPLAGVLVSDGKNVVQTNEQGFYELAGWDRAHLIYVNVLTQHHSDWYQMIQKGKREYDFEIQPAEENAAHVFLHLSDTEIGASIADSKGWIDFIKQGKEKFQPAFILHTGDICRKQGLIRHCQDMNSENMGCPVRYTLGNHDFVAEQYGEYTFEKYYGPVWYSFECGNIHYMVTSIEEGEAPSGYQKEDQWNWIQNNLDKKDPEKDLIVIGHGDGRLPKEFCFHTEERMALLKQHRLKAVVYGHYHVHSHYEENEIAYICTANPAFGGIDASPAGLRVISIDGQSVQSKIWYNDERKFEAPDAKAKWSVKLPGRIQYCEPLMREENGETVIYAGTVDDGWPKQCGIAKLDIHGKIKWFVQTKDSVKNNIAAADNMIYAQDYQGNVYGIDSCSGKIEWQQKIALGENVCTNSNTAVYQNKLIAGICQQVTAFDLKNGDILWQSEKTPRGNSTPSRFTFWKNLIITGANWSHLYALNINTGETVWEMKPDHMFFSYATPLIEGEKIVIPSFHEIVVAEAATGKIIESHQYSDICLNVSAQPVQNENVYYFATADQGVIAIKADTFEVIRQYKTGGAMLCSFAYSAGNVFTADGTIEIDQNILRFSASDGYLYEYEKDTEELLRKQRIGAPSFVRTTTVKDQIITADFNGRITAFDKKDQIISE